MTKVKKIPQSVPVLFADKAECCGCSACYAACPQGAISLQPDEEGFLYPIIEEKQCIRCGKCLTVCVFQEERKISELHQKKA